MAGVEDALVLLNTQVPLSETDRRDSIWKVGKYTFRADFDSGNLDGVRQGSSPSEFLLWTRRDCQDTDNERGTRSWFNFGVKGQQAGDFVVLTIQNLNKQGRLFSQDYRPWYWCQSMTEWQPTPNKVSYKREGDDFQLRFSHKFESGEEVFFAFAIPYSYRDTQALLTHIGSLFQHYTTVPAECVTPLNCCEPHSGYTSRTDTPVPGYGDSLREGRSSGHGVHFADEQGSDGGVAGHSHHQQQWQTAQPYQHRNGHDHHQHHQHHYQHYANHPAFKFQHPSEDKNPHSSRIYFRRQLLARSLEGRRIDLLTITDCYGASDSWEPQPVLGLTASQQHHVLRHRQAGVEGPDATSPLLPQDFGSGLHGHQYQEPPVVHFPGKKVFFISARVHPGETPATHMFNGLLAFLLRQHDPRAALLRRMYVFKLVPVVNPDGVYHGFYRTDTCGQNLNRFYIGNPDRELQPSVWAIKRTLTRYAQRGALEFYLDLHAHANKKGVFIFGNTLEGEQALDSLLYARLVSLNSPIFDFQQCNYTEKYISRPDKDGSSKEGAGRVALFRETGLVHLYTIEANYNTARVLNTVSPAAGDHGGRASPPSGRRFPPKFTASVLHSVGRALLVSALDLKGLNPWSRLPNTEHRSLDGVRAWLMSVVRSSVDVRAQHLPALSEACMDSLRELPNTYASAAAAQAQAQAQRAAAAGRSVVAANLSASMNARQGQGLRRARSNSSNARGQGGQSTGLAVVGEGVEGPTSSTTGATASTNQAPVPAPSPSSPPHHHSFHGYGGGGPAGTPNPPTSLTFAQFFRERMAAEALMSGFGRHSRQDDRDRDSGGRGSAGQQASTPERERESVSQQQRAPTGAPGSSSSSRRSFLPSLLAAQAATATQQPSSRSASAGSRPVSNARPDHSSSSVSTPQVSTPPTGGPPSREMGRSCSMPIRSAGPASGPGQGNSRARPSGIPRPPGFAEQLQAQVQASMNQLNRAGGLALGVNSLSENGSSSAGEDRAGDPDQTGGRVPDGRVSLSGQQQRAVLKQHQIAPHVIVDTGQPGSWGGPEGRAMSPLASPSQQQQPSSPQTPLACDPSSLLLNNGSFWHQQPSRGGPVSGAFSPRGKRSGLGLQQKQLCSGIPSSDLVDVNASNGAILRSLDDNGVLQTALEPVLSSLAIVGQLPAFRKQPRRSVGNQT